MAVFKKNLTRLTVHEKPGDIHKHSGKGSTQQRLPSRHALSSLTGGDMSDRNMNEYAKETPTIQEAPQTQPGSPASIPAPQGGGAMINGVGSDNM